MTLRHLYRHHRWANLALIDALAALPAEVLGLTSPGAYGTVHQTLTHMVEGEERYLATLKGAETTSRANRRQTCRRCPFCGKQPGARRTSWWHSPGTWGRRPRSGGCTTGGRSPCLR